MIEKFKILGKYIKDLSSETPDIETYVFVRECISKYQLSIDINSKALKNKMIEVNTTGTANIVDLSLKYNIERMCFVSSIATLGSNNNLPVDENCFWNWENQSGYAVSKHLAEMEVWRGFAEGLSGFIVMFLQSQQNTT